MIFNKISKYFLVLTAAAYVLCAPLWAMEVDDESTPSSVYQSAICPIEPEACLEFVKQCYDTYPGLTMQTPGPELWALYPHDLVFISQEFHKRPNAGVLMERLTSFDQEVQAKSPQHHLTFYHYVGIGKGWALIASDLEGYDAMWKEFMEELWEPEKSLTNETRKFFRYLPRIWEVPGIFMSYVSDTGILPIPVINDGMAFKTARNILGTVTFLAFPPMQKWILMGRVQQTPGHSLYMIFSTQKSVVVCLM